METFNPDDFFYIVERAKENDAMEGLEDDFCADPNLIYETSSAIVTIPQGIFYKSKGGENSLEGIFLKARQRGREIPFTGIIGEENLWVTEFIKGKEGTFGLCDWETGDLMERSYNLTKRNDKRVGLGHTHPKPFGAICSHVKWDKTSLKKFGDPTSLQILKSELYEKYAGDYCTLFISTKKIESISNFHWILTPKQNQVGVFETSPKKEGVVTYHPYRVV